MHFESLEELLQDLVLSLFATLDIWVLASIILTLDISNSKYSITVIINLLKCLNYELSSELIHRSNNNSNEFIKVNISVSVKIECLEKTVNILLANIDLEISYTFLELIHIKGTRIIVIHNFELSSETNHTSSTSLLELVSESLNNHALELWSRLSVLDNNLRLHIFLWSLSRLWVMSTLEWVSGRHILPSYLLELLILFNDLFLLHWWS